MVGGRRGHGRVRRGAGDAGGAGLAGDGAGIERAEAVVDARGEVVVAAYRETRERDVGGGDAELDDGRVSRWFCRLSMGVFFLP